MADRTEETPRDSGDAGIQILAQPARESSTAETVTGASENGDADPSIFRRKKGVVVATGVAAAVVALATIGVYTASTSNAAGQYRLASATQGSVTQSITLTGTLAPVSEANVKFPTSGTVAAVYVKTGQKVKAGQKLAKLNTQQLAASVTTAKKSLADAELNLEQTEAGTTTTSGGSGGGGQVQTRSDRVPNQQPPAGGTAQLQQAIKMTQKSIDAAIAASKISMKAAVAACSTQGEGEAQPTGSPSQSPSSSAETDCAAAQQKVLDDQMKVSELQQLQTTQIENLNKATQSAAKKPSTSPSTTTTTTEPTGEQLASAQSQVNAAQASVNEAEQNLRAATIVSPISGTVLAVPFAKGDQASASDVIVISGSAQYQATVQVAVDKISEVAIGQDARVVPSGSTPSLDGTVAAIAAAPTSTDSTVTYGVTINIASENQDLRSGATADVEIITAQAGDTITVPTSAVTALGSLRTVTVLKDGQATSARVTVGAVGPIDTQIIDGLQDGDQVVLADLNEAMPSGNATAFRIPSGGGFPGGGGGGFPGGGAGRSGP